MTKRIRSPFALALLLAALLTQTGCGPKAATSVQMTPQQKSLKTVDDIRVTGRALVDSYMSFYRNRLAQIKADKSLDDKSRHAAIAALTTQAQQINDIYGKSIDLETQAGNVIRNNANFSGPPVIQALSLSQQLAGLFNDPIFASIGDQTLHTIVAAAQASIQILIVGLQSQVSGGSNER